MVNTKRSISGRNRKEEVIITRMRFGHSGLNASLFVTGIHETGLCGNCGEKETVEHVIYNCTRYDEERKELISYLNKKDKVNKDLEYLLGYDFNRDRVGYRILIKYMYTCYGNDETFLHLRSFIIKHGHIQAGSVNSKQVWQGQNTEQSVEQAWVDDQQTTSNKG